MARCLRCDRLYRLTVGGRDPLGRHASDLGPGENTPCWTSLPAHKAYRILEPGPIVLVSTRAADGRANLMTMGFHMMMQHAPTLVINLWIYSHRALTKAVPTMGLSKTVADRATTNC